MKIELVEKLNALISRERDYRAMVFMVLDQEGATSVKHLWDMNPDLVGELIEMIETMEEELAPIEMGFEAPMEVFDVGPAH